MDPVPTIRSFLFAAAGCFLGGFAIAQEAGIPSTLDAGASIDVDSIQIDDRNPQRWHFSAGLTTRSVKADMALQSPGLKGGGGIFNRRAAQGRGDVGLFTGGPGTIVYDDGSVGPAGVLSPPFDDDGTAQTTVQSASQVSPPTGRREPNSDTDIVEVSFHTTLDQYGYRTDGTARDFFTSDSDIGVGPYVQFLYTIADKDDFIANFLVGYSWVSTDHSTGDRVLVNEEAVETRNSQRFTYIYDHDLRSGIDTSSFPFVDPGSNTIFDAETYNDFYNDDFPPDAFDPRQTIVSSESERTIQLLAIGRADLDVDLQEIPIGFEIGRRFGTVELYFTAGASINFIDYELTSHLDWYRSGNPNPIASQQWRDAGSEVKPGFFAGFSSRCPLSDDGRFFFETHATYRWVDSFTATAGIASVEVNPGSVEAGCGFGFVF